jgi:hypothetical protein
MPHVAPLSTHPVLATVRADAESFATGWLITGRDEPLVTIAMFPQAAESRLVVRLRRRRERIGWINGPMKRISRR